MSVQTDDHLVKGKSFIDIPTQTENIFKDASVPSCDHENKPIQCTNIVQAEEKFSQSVIDGLTSCDSPSNTPTPRHASSVKSDYGVIPTVTNMSWMDKIETLVIGDATLLNFKQSSDITFKVARKNACTADLVNTTIFFLNKFPNVKTVFFHGGTKDMKSGQTETLKSEYVRLMALTIS